MKNSLGFREANISVKSSTLHKLVEDRDKYLALLRECRKWMPDGIASSEFDDFRARLDAAIGEKK